MFNRVGGLKEEVPAGWTGRARDAIDQVRRVVGSEVDADRLADESVDLADL